MSTDSLSLVEKQRLIWTNPWVFIACGFGVGTLPIMPGTYGTFLGVGLVLFLYKLSFWWNIAVLVLLFLAGVWLCGYANKKWGTLDHPAAVWDEVVTFPWAMLFVPITPVTLLVAFLLFRFFDIVKPGPIRWVDKHCHGGFGVMLDDWIAAIASLIVIHLYLWVF
jgi:phosphatidylglycerophosphatase A